jgi:hypothetical protein
MSEIIESAVPSLFMHGTRKDWGVGVLAGVRDGKRRYLFESGEERVMGSGEQDMMRKIAPIDRDQELTLARLLALVARGEGVPNPSKTVDSELLEQLAGLRRAFPGGFADPAWQSEGRATRTRETVLPEARELLSVKALDAQLKAQRFDALWESVSKVLRATNWLPAAQLATAANLGPIASAVRELLYGTTKVEQRFDRFVAAYETAFRQPVRWETATALLALMFPADHLLVDLGAFRKQLKAIDSQAPLPQRPSGAGYVRCANAARIIANKLRDNGEAPQDLLDIHDFIRVTLKPAPAARPAKASKAPRKKAATSEAPAADVSTDESAVDAN